MKESESKMMFKKMVKLDLHFKTTKTYFVLQSVSWLFYYFI